MPNEFKRNAMMTPRLVGGFLVSAALVVTGCRSVGSTRLVPDRFDYSEAIARSAKEQMLVNLVRLRYRDVPVFLSVSSVLTQYVYSGTVGVEGSSGRSLGDSMYSVGGSARMGYAERPTITYTPLRGDEFAEQLLKPIPTRMVFSLFQSGWPAVELLTMALYRINGEVNVAFDPSAPEEDVRRLQSFREVVELWIELAKWGAVEMQAVESDSKDWKGSEARQLVFEKNADPAVQELIDQFKERVRLDAERDVFRVTERSKGIQPDEITLRVRSLLELMGFLSQGVEIPEQHVSDNRVDSHSIGTHPDVRALIPLRVRSQAERPDDVFVAVQYQDHWFYIEHSDHLGKQAFSLLSYLFELQSPRTPTLGPVITVPTG